MSENCAFPDRLMLFRRDREMTQGDHFVHDPSDWRWYVREDLCEAQPAEIAALRRQLAEARDKALEEAAEEAETEGWPSDRRLGDTEREEGSMDCAERIAAAIRALKGAAK